jgi:hypothetical protein
MGHVVESWSSQHSFCHAATTVILHYSQNYYTEVLNFSKNLYHTSLYGPIASGTSVSPTLYIHFSTMLVLLNNGLICMGHVVESWSSQHSFCHAATTLLFYIIHKITTLKFLIFPKIYTTHHCMALLQVALVFLPPCIFIFPPCWYYWL